MNERDWIILGWDVVNLIILIFLTFFVAIMTIRNAHPVFKTRGLNVIFINCAFIVILVFFPLWGLSPLDTQIPNSYTAPLSCYYYILNNLPLPILLVILLINNLWRKLSINTLQRYQMKIWELRFQQSVRSNNIKMIQSQDPLKDKEIVKTTRMIRLIKVLMHPMVSISWIILCIIVWIVVVAMIILAFEQINGSACTYLSSYNRPLHITLYLVNLGLHLLILAIGLVVFAIDFVVQMKSQRINWSCKKYCQRDHNLYRTEYLFLSILIFILVFLSYALLIIHIGGQDLYGAAVILVFLYSIMFLFPSLNILLVVAYYYFVTRRRVNSLQTIGDLMKLDKTSETKNSFLQFTRREWCSEVFMICDALIEWNKITDEENKKRKALDIVEFYFVDDAVMPISVAATTKQDLLNRASLIRSDQISSLELTQMFVPLEKEVYQSLQTVFNRFISSPEHLDWRKSFRESFGL